MGIVYKSEPMPPPDASHEEKMAWYWRERARAVGTMKRQAKAFPFVPLPGPPPPPPPYPPQEDQPIMIGGLAPGIFIGIVGIGLAAAAFILSIHHHG